MAHYESLLAWKECHALVLVVYRVTRQFPKEELYGLTSQARRAAFSAAANIAEGAAKRGPREFRRFLDISLGSLAELAYTLRLAKELGMLPEHDWGEVDELRNRAGYLTWQLYRGVSRRVGPSTVPDRP
jgi:four helix bundle protein